MYIKKKIEKEYSRFIKNQFKKMFMNYDEDNIFIPSCVSEWKKYYYKNDECCENIAKLKTGMDRESQLLVDKVLETFVFLLPEYKYKDYFLFNYDKFFTKEDALSQKEITPINTDLTKLGMQDHSIFKYHCGLKYIPDNILNSIKHMDFIDGGAFIGDSSYIFTEYTNGKIYAFEPNKDNFEGLFFNINQLKLNESIIPIKMGLADKKQSFNLYGSSVSCTLNEFEKVDSQNAEVVEVTDIDSFVNENNLNPGLIKLDIEGFELEAIKGAIQTISCYSPVLLVSIYHLPKDFFEIKPMIEDLQLGYKFLIRKLYDFHPVNETMLIGYTD